MKRIGITGGIGSGKSAVCQLLQGRGYPVFYCDIVARQLMQEDQMLRCQIERLVGSLERSALREYIGRGLAYARHIDELVWPRVADSWRAFCEAQRQQGANLVFMECALLYESGFNGLVDESVLVTAGEDMRIQRVMQRDGITAERARSIMALQMPEDEKRQHATYVIYNDGSLDMLCRQIDNLKIWRQE